jgi:hypothetical protein
VSYHQARRNLIHIREWMLVIRQAHVQKRRVTVTPDRGVNLAQFGVGDPFQRLIDEDLAAPPQIID